MNILKRLNDRKIALVVLVASVLLMTPVGMNVSLSRAVRKVEAGVSDGVEIENSGSVYTSKGLDTLLDSVQRHALGLVSTGNTAAPSEAGALDSARTALMNAKTPGEKYTANAEMCAAVEALSSALDGKLSESDQEEWSYYLELFELAEGSISLEAANYNSSVSDFTTQVLGRFPANLIADVFSIDPPESFGGTQ